MNSPTVNRRKVLCVEGMPEAGLRLLAARPEIEVEVLQPTELHRLPESLADASAVTLRTARYDRSLIEASPRVEVAARYGVGYDTVDVDALTERGVPLMIAGTANSRSVAEHAFFLMIALAKLVLPFHRSVVDDHWSLRYERQGFDLAGKTLLVIGCGRIGSRTTALSRAFGMTVEVFDPYVADSTVEEAGGRAVADLDSALSRADVVSIHCPKNSETTDLLDRRRLSRMKSTALLVNTARGGIVDEDALADALLNGRLAGAGLDVFAEEPVPAGHPLVGLDNVLLSPHVAGLSVEAKERMAITTCQNVLDVFDGRPDPDHVVNPEVLEGKT